MILRFEDAVALKSSVNFYLTKGCELNIIKAHGFHVVLKFRDLKDEVTIDSLIHGRQRTTT